MDTWFNILIEVGLFAFLGLLYYLYQRKKILDYEKNKGPVIAGYLMQSCLMERGEETNQELDALIEALDNYIHNRSSTLPIALLKHYSHTSACSTELKDVIEEGIAEWEK